MGRNGSLPDSYLIKYQSILKKYIIKFCFIANGKWNNNNSNSNIQYNTNLLNILNNEIMKKTKYGVDLMDCINENKDYLTK